MPGSGNRSGGAAVRTAPAQSSRDRAALPAGVSMSEPWYGKRSYTFDVGGKTVKFNIEGGIVDFNVGGSLSRGGLTGRDADRAALTIARIFKHDVASRPDGYTYKTNAFTLDGYGARRAEAYERAGFSAPTGRRPGGNQYGIVRDGKLIPIGGREYATATRNFNRAASDAFLTSLLD